MTALEPRRGGDADSLGAKMRPRLFALCGAAALLFAGLYALAIGTATGRRIDGQLLGEPLTDGHVFGLAARIVDHFNVQIAIPAAAALILFCLVRGGTRTALVLGAALAGSVISARLLKELLANVDLVGGELARGVGSGFYPSGHSTTVMALVLAAVIAAPTVRLRRTLVLAGGLCAAAVGVGHVLVQSHEASDVVAGYLLAVIWMAGAACVIGPRHATVPSLLRCPAALAAPVTLVIIVVACATADRGGRWSEVLGSLALTAASLWLVTVFAAVLEPANQAVRRRAPRPLATVIGRAERGR